MLAPKNCGSFNIPSEENKAKLILDNLSGP